MNCVKSSRLISVSLAAIVSVLLLGSEATAQVLTLEGETLSATGQAATVTCDPKGLLSFSGQGAAVGPFPGTFVESGDISFDPAAGGQISVVNISFAILFYDELGRQTAVKGRKFLKYGDGVAHCALDKATGVTTFSATAFLDYDAKIGEGEILDNGKATLDLGGSFAKFLALKFTQIFHSSNLVISTLGKVTGGGNIVQTAGGRGVTFGFNAQNTDRGMKGSGSIIDHNVGTTIKILDVTTLAIAGTHATILGTAEVNGVVENYRIDVEDLGEPGADSDSFKIVTDTYGTSGILTGGNIQIS